MNYDVIGLTAVPSRDIRRLFADGLASCRMYCYVLTSSLNQCLSDVISVRVIAWRHRCTSACLSDGMLEFTSYVIIEKTPVCRHSVRENYNHSDTKCNFQF